MKTAVHLLAALATLLAATRAAPAQLVEAPDDVAARMAQRRMQQLPQNAPVAGPTTTPTTTPTAAPAAAAPLPPATVLPAPSPATSPSAINWPDLVTRLSSDSFAEREAAQAQLQKTTWRDHDFLKQLADSTPDPEAKARLAAQLHAIEELMAYDPPPISLDLKNASLFDMVQALEKATGEKFSPDNNGRNMANIPGNNNGPGFTLSVKDMPFWDVVRELNAQHGLRIQGYNGLSFYQSNPGMKPTQIVGGMAVFAQSISRNSSVDLQNDPVPRIQPASLSIQYSVALDPRLKVVKYRQPRLLDVIDDAGNVLLHEMPDADRQNGWQTQTQTRVWSTGQSLQIPHNLGKNIVSAKGEFHAFLQLAAESIDVADPDKKLNQPFTVAGQTATITQFSVNGSAIQFNINRKNEPGVNFQDQPAMTVSFIDANGTLIWSSGLQGGTGGGVGANNIVQPVKVQFSVATKTKEINIPFEFKDLPLPPP